MVVTESDRKKQGVTKRCRLSFLTNSALVIRVQLRGGKGVLRGLSQIKNKNKNIHIENSWMLNQRFRELRKIKNRSLKCYNRMLISTLGSGQKTFSPLSK